MEPNLSILLARILSGKYKFVYNKKKYQLKYPNIDTKYSAELFAHQEIEKNKFNSWITEEDILSYLVDNKLWTQNGDEEFLKIEKSIEDAKVDLYTHFWNDIKKDIFKKQIVYLKTLVNKMYNVRHSMDHLTPEGYAKLLKSQYIFIHSLYDNKNKKVFKSFNTTDFYKLNHIFSHVNENTISIEDFKKVARFDSWRSYWSANKQNLFDKPVIEWTDEQKTLVVLTKMYDNAYEHPECPTEDVFEDDDAFDGWMILQKRENEKSKQKNKAEKLLKGKNLDKAGEVFIMASSTKEANSIYSLNDATSRHTIKERDNIIKTKQVVQEAQLPDVQRNLNTQRNQQFIQSRKRK